MSTVGLRDVSKVFPDGTVAVNRLSLEIDAGEFMVLLGPSGCGKSTILRMIAGLEDPTGGEVWLEGRRADSLAPRERGVAMVFQDFALYPHMTVGDNIGFPLKVANVDPVRRSDQVAEVASALGIGDVLRRHPTQLSGGQRQRVAIARALVGSPAIVLADEPTGNLDSVTGASIMALLRELNGAGATILMITHDAALADQTSRQIHLLDGQVVS